MTIEQKGIVDLISMSPDGDIANLIISDHLVWESDGRGHMLLLQEKINEYLSFIEGGALFDVRPYLKGKRLILKVVGLYELTQEANDFYNQLRDVLAREGYPFVFEHRPDDSI